MILHPVPLERLDDWWPIVLPFAVKMAKRFPDDWPTTETLRQARSAELQLWLALDDENHRAVAAAGTMVVIKASGKRVLALRWLSGAKPERWLHLLPGIEDYGRFNGCSELLIEPGSRAGWQRLIPDYRAKPTVQLTKGL